MGRHIIFYDGECPLCNRAVRFLLRVDRHKLFQFAPLQGTTAATKLPPLPPLNTLILLQEGRKIFIEGRGVFRIFWLLGGRYALLGWLSFLPPFLFNPFYRLVARYRYRLFSSSLPLNTTDPDRFLP